MERLITMTIAQSILICSVSDDEENSKLFCNLGYGRIFIAERIPVQLLQ